jgi:hypothetical protein
MNTNKIYALYLSGILNESQFHDAIEKNYLEDAMQHGEGYQEAGELMSQTHPAIMQFLAKTGIPHIKPGTAWTEEDNNNAIASCKAIDQMPSNLTLQSKDIAKLDNLANKPGQQQLPQQLLAISGQPDAAQKYIQLMQSRDQGEGRNRGYNVEDLVKKIQTGTYSPPILIKGGSGFVVVGGRTRLYAALATNTPIKVKVLDENSIRQALNLKEWQVFFLNNQTSTPSSKNISTAK